MYGRLPWQFCNFTCEITNYRRNFAPKLRSNSSPMILSKKLIWLEYKIKCIAWENGWQFKTRGYKVTSDKKSAEIPYRWHVTTQIWVVLLIWSKVCFIESEVLPTITDQSSYASSVKNRISVLISQISFHGETRSSIAKRWLSFQTIK